MKNEVEASGFHPTLSMYVSGRRRMKHEDHARIRDSASPTLLQMMHELIWTINATYCVYQPQVWSQEAWYWPLHQLDGRDLVLHRRGAKQRISLAVHGDRVDYPERRLALVYFEWLNALVGKLFPCSIGSHFA